MKANILHAQHRRASRPWRLLIVLLILLNAIGGLPGVFSVQPVGAADATGLANERVVYRGEMYETFVSDGNPSDPNNTKQPIAVCRKPRNADACASVTYLAGETLHHPVLAAADNNNMLTVFARGKDDAIYFRSLVGTGSNPDTGSCVGSQTPTAGFTCWKAIPDTSASDEPIAYGGPDFVAVVWRDKDGFKRQNVSTDGINFAGTQASLGLGIPLGTNLINGSLSSSGGFSQSDKDAIEELNPSVMRVRMFLSDAPMSPRFSLDDLDYLVAKGVRTLILNGAEGSLDYATFDGAISQTISGANGTYRIIDLSRRSDNNWDKVNVYFELGNEPDRYFVDTAGTGYSGSDNGSSSRTNARSQRKNAIETARNFYTAPPVNPNDPNERKAVNYPNYRLMISLPTRLPDKRAGYFSNVGSTHGNRTAARSNRPIYITESGVRADVANYGNDYGNKWNELGKRYVDSLLAFDIPDGRVRGVTYFQTAIADQSPAFQTLNIDSDYSTTPPKHATYTRKENGVVVETIEYPAHFRMGVKDRNQYGGCRAPNDLGDRTLQPAQSAFTDVYGYTFGYEAIQDLYRRGIVRGYNDGTGRFGPEDQLLRAQAAGLVARALGWQNDSASNPFTDQGFFDSDLWRNVGVLNARNVARGYNDAATCATANVAAPCFLPADPVLRAQTVAFMTRAMINAGHWQAQPDNPQIYPNVPANSDFRVELSTYYYYAGTVPGTPAGMGPFVGYDQPATRGVMALVVQRALLTIGATKRPVALAATTPMPMYGDTIGDDFTDGSYGYTARNTCDTSVPGSSGCAYAITLASGGALNFVSQARVSGDAPAQPAARQSSGPLVTSSARFAAAPLTLAMAGGQMTGGGPTQMSTTPYERLEFSLHLHGQAIDDLVVLFADNTGTPIVYLPLTASDIVATTLSGWARVSIAVARLNPTDRLIEGIQIKNNSFGTLAPIHVDDVRLSPPTILYDNAFRSGFTDGSYGYASRNACDTAVRASTACSYAIAFNGSGALNFIAAPAQMSTAPYGRLEFSVQLHGQPISNLKAFFADNAGQPIVPVTLAQSDVIGTTADGWTRVAVAVARLNPSGIPIDGFQIRNATTGALPTLHFDDVRLVAPVTLYDNAFRSGFADGSYGYASRNTCDTATKRSPGCSYRITLNAWGALNFIGIPAQQRTEPYERLEFWVHLHGQPVTKLAVLLADNTGTPIVYRGLTTADVAATSSDGWARVSIPLSELNPNGVPFDGIQIKNNTAGALQAIHIDDVALIPFDR